jgi:hypothetical protein
MEMVNVLVV